ncbi:MAG: TrkH family potassium uptake protein [Bacteroidales bacterium]|jgi:trk system potassium uptake protein TrkH|nr:TrkH family potassium uptake protein [Bacteroidales bacterium]
MIKGKIIFNILGMLLIIEGVFLLFSTLVALYYNGYDLFPLLISSFICIIVGGLSWFFTRNTKKDIGKREGYVIVSLVWVVFSLFGALPFIISGAIPSYTDAFFETMSGFTTTGASILNDIEAVPHGLLFWRSLTQWIGGMGMIVLSLAILPIFGFGGMQLFFAEVPGPTNDKFHPRVNEIARRLWIIYIVLTAAETILLKIGGMSWFDAVNHSFTTMATGGYSTKQDSIAYFNSPFIHYTIAVFMILAGVNFTLFYYAIHLKFRKVVNDEEFRFYIGFLLFFTIVIAGYLVLHDGVGLEKSFRDALFQVSSIMTTTGYITVNYVLWTPFIPIILLVLMFIGGSAGSTAGSIKVIRISLLLKNSWLELKRMFHPNAIIPVRINNKSVPSQILSNMLAFVVIYMLITIISTIIMASMGYDLSTSLSAVATSIGNIGPGLGQVGPVENFSHIPVFGKWFLAFLMMIGRLEIFTVLMILSPAFWRK